MNRSRLVRPIEMRKLNQQENEFIEIHTMQKVCDDA